MTQKEISEKKYRKRKRREAILESRRASARTAMPGRINHYRDLIRSNMTVKPMLGVLKKDHHGRVIRPTLFQAIWYWIRYPFRDRSNPPVARAMQQMVGM